MYIYSYLFFLYLCKDYCHRVTTELQLIVVIVIIIINLINQILSAEIRCRFIL